MCPSVRLDLFVNNFHSFLDQKCQLSTPIWSLRMPQVSEVKCKLWVFKYYENGICLFRLCGKIIGVYLEIPWCLLSYSYSCECLLENYLDVMNPKICRALEKMNGLEFINQQLSRGCIILLDLCCHCLFSCTLSILHKRCGSMLAFRLVLCALSFKSSEYCKWWC